MRIRAGCLSVALGAAGLLVSGCSRGAASANDNAPPAKIEAAPEPGVYELKHPEQFPLVRVGTRRMPDELLVNGVVAPDVQRTVHVTSLAGGRVVDIRARLGDEVAKGQVLLVIDSSDLAGAISDYKKALADEVLANKALDRAETLHSHGALAEKELEQAEDAEAKAKIDVTTAAERIRLLGGDLAGLSPVIEVRAPVAGAIVEQNTTGGEGVKSLDNSPSLFTVADLSRVWVLCDVYENDLGDVHLGDSAELRLNAYPGRSLRGRVANISPVLDPVTRAAKVRLELPNPGGLMRPGMFATARFVSSRSRERVLVPASALLRLHDKDWVFRSEGGGRFRRTQVQAGPALADGWQEVLTGGVRAGDEIVADALQFSSATEEM
jgi:cobalt-zinc-cadmium efflux system membrane fusion protein